MADVWAIKSGNWSDPTVWNTQSVPTSVDDVYSNSRNVILDTALPIRANTITNSWTPAGSSGGSFFVNNGASIFANVYNLSTSLLIFLSAFPNSFSIVGNISGSAPGNALLNNSTGIVNITGNLYKNFIWATSASGNFGSAVLLNRGGFVSISGSIVNRPYPGLILDNDSGTTSITGSFLTTGDAVDTNPNRDNGNCNRNVNGTVFIRGNVEGFRSESNNTNTFLNQNRLIMIGDVLPAWGRYNINIWNTSTIRNTYFFLSGNILGNTAYSNIVGTVTNNNAGRMDMIGNVTGVSGRRPTYFPDQNCAGILNTQTYQCYITGNVYGAADIGDSRQAQSGVINRDYTTFVLEGTAMGRSGWGVYNGIFGTITDSPSAFIKRAKGGPGGITNSLQAYAGVYGNPYAGTFVEEIEFGDQGGTPVNGNIFINNKPNTVCIMKNEGNGTSNFRNVIFFSNLSAIANLFPPISSVRLGIRYGNDDYTGTMIVPPKEAVSYGIPVDNTLGVFVIDAEAFWAFSRSYSAINDTETIGFRVKHTPTLPNLGSFMGAFNVSGFPLQY